jgi:hypothetical protein
MGGKNMQCHMPDGRPDYEALALHADQQAEQAEARHLAALWRELATTYRELGQYHGALSTERLRFTGSASRLRRDRLANCDVREAQRHGSTHIPAVISGME